MVSRLPTLLACRFVRTLPNCELCTTGDFMTPIQEYYSARDRLELSIKKIECLYPLLDGSRPLMRARLVAQVNDIRQNSELCYSAFLGCLPFSFHMMIGLANFAATGVELKNLELAEYQSLSIKKYNTADGLNSEEEKKWLQLQNRVDASVKNLNALFGEAGGRLHQDRIAAEDRLRASSRSFIFSCRIFQDVLYSLALIALGEGATSRSSMAKGIKNEKFLSLFNDSKEYTSWFQNFRDLRNLLKNGSTCGVGLGNLNVSLSYDDPSDNKAVKVGGAKFSLFGLSEALNRSGDVVDAICSTAVKP